MTSCTAADNVSLELPPMIIDMLMNREFKPDPRSELASLLNVKVRSQITTRNLEESPTISLAHILAKIIGNDSRTQDESQGDSEVVQRYSTPGGINHTRKVKEYPDVRHISYEEIKSRLFVNISEVFICFQRIVNDYPIAQLYLSRCYYNGFGTKVNNYLAFFWMKNATENGSKCAQYELGCLYYCGIGIESNLEKALYCFELILVELDFIHKQEIIHRDFHSGNILIENESDIVTSDLGISKLSTDSSDDERNYYGIMPYIAPEIFQGKECNTYTKAADIYSFGMIMWELMNGKRPFEDRDCDTDLMIQIIDGARPPIVTNAPEGYIELMQQCWDSDPNKRPTSRDIFKLISKIILNEEKVANNIIISPEIGPTNNTESNIH
ncbi:9713_t:CDS:2, partial [Funneliformis geosporum]